MSNLKFPLDSHTSMACTHESTPLFEYSKLEVANIHHDYMYIHQCHIHNCHDREIKKLAGGALASALSEVITDPIPL